MAWQVRKNPKLAVGILLGSDMIYKDMLKAALALWREPGTLFLFESRKYDVALSRNILAAQALREGVDWLLYWDSVASYTPIIVRDPLTHEVDILPIEDLAEFRGKGKEYQKVNLEVLTSNDKWTPIKHVMRHPFEGQLYRINIHSGLVDVSGNHSICGLGNHKPIKGAELKVGDKIATPRIWVPRKRLFFFGGKELAWFYGFFAAEGSVSGICVSITNKDEKLIRRCADIFSTYFGLDLELCEERGRLWKVGTCRRKLAFFFKTRFYTKSGLKKVPKEILNAPPEIKYSFLRGFNDGDGSKTIYGTQEFKEFSCHSQVLAEGLIWLIKGTTNQPCSVLARKDKEYVRINLPKDQRKDRRIVKKILRVPYDGYLYDVETEDHRFIGGVGGILLHNSDVVPPANAIPRLLAHNVPMVTGLYWRRHPNLEPCVYKLGKNGIPVPYTNEELSRFEGRLAEIEACGMGLCLIHVPLVLEKLKPYCEEFTLTDPESKQKLKCWRFFESIVKSNVTLSEDIVFSSKVRNQLKMKIYADVGLKCGHLTNVMVKYGRFNWTPLTVGREI